MGGLPALAKKVKDLQGQNNWAVVEGDNGNIVRQFSSAGPVTGSHTAGTGLYTVTFSKDVAGCAFVATLGSVNTNAPTIGTIGVTGDSADGNSLMFKPRTLAAILSTRHFISTCHVRNRTESSVGVRSRRRGILTLARVKEAIAPTPRKELGGCAMMTRATRRSSPRAFLLQAPAVDGFDVEPPVATHLKRRYLLLLQQPVDRGRVHP